MGTKDQFLIGQNHNTDKLLQLSVLLSLFERYLFILYCFMLIINTLHF